MSQRPVARRVTIPKARWGTKGGRNAWSMTVLSSLRGHASRLPDTVPADIATWCPAYPSASRENREAFWLGLVSALAKHESTYRPTAVGGGGLWYGLLQILPSTARSYGCQADSASDLKDPRLNLSCGLRIMARTVARDGVVSRNMRGVAADWGPFHSRQKREDMIAWTRAQDYCTGMSRSLRPVARPGTMDAPQLLAAGPTHRPAARPSSEIASAVPAVPSARVTALYGSEIIATSGTLERDLRNYAID
ncbi:transglycosylase SLT domain-containing protein [Salipiger sp.]